MEHSKQPFLKRLLSVRGMGAALTAFAGLIIIYIAFGLINPTVFSGRNIVNLTRSMSKYLIIGIGQSYLLITGEDENYEDFRARMLGVFTESCLEQLDFDQRFRPVDGKLAALAGGVGGAIDYAECPDAYRLESAGDDAVTFTLIGHYIEQGAEETDTEFLTRRANGEFDSTQEFTIRLENTENGWRVDEFHSPLYPYTF